MFYSRFSIRLGTSARQTYLSEWEQTLRENKQTAHSVNMIRDGMMRWLSDDGESLYSSKTGKVIVSPSTCPSATLGLPRRYSKERFKSILARDRK
jgi:hypothetical protein